MDKIKYGQFYTINNPFENELFYKWYELIENIEEKTILEPFAGENNIVELIKKTKLIQAKKWNCYDIKKPKKNKVKNIEIKIRDTILDFPKGYDVAITNPPYLAKNRATLKNIEFDKNYDDLYLKCIDIMLKNVKYIAAIIPESFLTYSKFKDRLYAIISLEMKMFNDTSCPVCLALFVPEKTNYYYIYKKNKIILNKDLEKYLKEYPKYINWKFNDSNGNIGLRAVDNLETASIKFTKSDEIDSEIKISSRALTKISGIIFENEKMEEYFIKKINENLLEYREKTNDCFLTSFKCLRKDLRYRRRLDYKTARNLLNKTYYEIYIYST